jgi:hypothetical protein
MFVIKHRKTGCFVTKPGSEKAYTRDVRKARLYTYRNIAEKEMCPENETVVPLGTLFER